jgi:hypothetical protein
MTAPERQRRAVLALVALAAVALGVLVLRNTEWVDVTIPRAYTGKAAESPTYALERLLERTGTVVVSRTDLAVLPPREATLLLRDWNWGVLPERDRALRAWVEAGGQLVLSRWIVTSLGNDGWIPVDTVRPAGGKGKDPASKDRAPAPQTPSPRRARPATISGLPPEEPCRPVHEPPGMAEAYPAAERPVGAVEPAAGAEAPDETPGAPSAYPTPAGDEAAPSPAAAPEPATGLQLCVYGWTPLTTTAPTLWALQSGEHGAEVLRIALGRGSVTVLPGPSLLGNHNLLRGDDSLIALAALQAGTGSQVWIVSAGSGDGLLAWIWEHGRSAVLAALLALALWLWRSSLRFGPPRGPAPATRRSMIEQITGTAEFLWRRSPAALHAAQLRALEEAAARRVHDFAVLDREGRAAAIARATGYDAGALALAMDAVVGTRPGTLGSRLATLELARRALAAAPARIPTHPGDEQ